MKKALLLATIVLLSALLGCINAVAQVSAGRVISFPSWKTLYYDSKYTNIYGEKSNINMFFSEWEEWSQLIKKGAAPSEYNAIFNRHFSEYNRTKECDAKYLSLPLRVKVIKYDCNIHPDSIKVIKNYTLMSSLMESIMPESISYFTPVLESEKKVLYLSPEAEKVLAAFLDEPLRVIQDGAPPGLIKKVSDKDWEETNKRCNMLEKYIPTIIGHWGRSWYFTSYPQIDTIIVGKDGYYIECNDANYSGQRLFVPWGEDPIDMGWWIQ